MRPTIVTSTERDAVALARMAQTAFMTYVQSDASDAAPDPDPEYLFWANEVERRHEAAWCAKAAVGRRVFPVRYRVYRLIEHACDWACRCTGHAYGCWVLNSTPLNRWCACTSRLEHRAWAMSIGA